MRYLRFGVFALVVLLAWTTAPRAWRATALGLDLAKGTAIDAGAVARREVVGYAVDGRHGRADLYTPIGDAPQGALVLIAGADRIGKDHPQFIAFASALAHAGFVVMVPDIASLRELRLRHSDAAAVADAAFWLSERERRRVGLAAVSYGVGPAVLAALDPRLATRLGFLLGIGGYYDLRAVLAAFPNEYGKWLFVAANLDAVEDARDRTTLAAMAGRKLADRGADLSDLAATLGPAGQPIYALARNTEPSRADALIAALPAPLKAEIDGLTLKGRDLTRLPAPVLLVHGADDPLIPAAESARLAQAIGDKAELHVIEHMRHVQLGGDALDVARLWWVCWRLLALR